MAPKQIYIKEKKPPIKPKISVAIRLKNEALQIENLLTSIASQTLSFPIEIIALDSGSTDGSIDILKRYSDKIYAIDPNEFQFGKSCNQITELCNGQYILLISGHVFFDRTDALEKSISILEKDESIGVVYFGQKTHGIKYIDFSPYEKLFLESRFPNNNKIIDVKKGKIPASNAAAIIRKETWEAIKFPEVIASEDFLWAKQIAKENWKIYYLGTIQAIHNHNESSDSIKKRVRINKIAQYGEHPEYKKAFISFVKVFLGLLIFEKTSLKTAFSYAIAHAESYV
jgi:rhamnosyltransferase